MITLEHIYKTYGRGDSATQALRDVCLQIRRGEMLGIMGASGSGKSTLLNILGGMDHFDSGEYHFDDLKIHELEKNRLYDFRKKHVAFVFQQFALMNQYTVYENVELPLRIKNISKKVRKEIVYQALDQMGICELAGKLPAKLSGGQQQRCAIARAVVSGNDLILADEPTGALDMQNGIAIMEILKQLHEQGKTIVVVTHDSRIAECTQRIIHMEDGRIVANEES